MNMRWADAELLHQPARDRETAREIDRGRHDLDELPKDREGLIVRGAVRSADDAATSRATGMPPERSEGPGPKAKPEGTAGAFTVQPDIELLDRVGLADDRIGAMVDAFVIDDVLDRASMPAGTMDLSPPTCTDCGDPYSAHQHFRPGTDCGRCPCQHYRGTTTRSPVRRRTRYGAPRSAVGLTQRLPRRAGRVYRSSSIPVRIRPAHAPPIGDRGRPASVTPRPAVRRPESSKTD